MNFELRSERVPDVRPKRFGDSWLHYYVRIRLEAVGERKFEDVDLVVYVLDPSFEDDRYEVSDARRSRFATEIWTYDFFRATAKVLYRDGSYENVEGHVRWDGRVEAREEA